MGHYMTRELIGKYIAYLYQEERSKSTIEKYEKDIEQYYHMLPADGSMDKETVLQWKQCMSQQYAASTVNVKLAALNGLFAYAGWPECQAKPVRQQKKIFRARERELTKGEYLRLLEAAKRRGKERLYYLMETLCSTGMRVSELRYVTAEALRDGIIYVNCKGKSRTVMLTKQLRRVLREYCRQHGIRSGPVFITRNGKALDRSNIWREMQGLCRGAGVAADKVFPHNFRHLFAVSFYNLKKDIAKLADLLGHASIETTRIYIMESGVEHERQIERLGLVLP